VSKAAPSGKPRFGRLAKTLFSKEIEGLLAKDRTVFLAQFSNVSVNALGELRKNLRKSQTQLLVVKNSLCRKALGGSPRYKGLEPLVGGQCAVGVSEADPARVSKIFVTFSDEQAGFRIAGAAVGGEIFDRDMVKHLAMLPSREELIAKAVGGLKAPLAGMVYVLNGVLSGLVNVIEQIRKGKEEPK
jgi:large subunit ribosomal protein L10